MVLCDTNILIEVYKNNVVVIEVLTKIGQSHIVVSDVTSAELFFGARNKRELQIIRKDLNKLSQFPINHHISEMAVELVEKFALSHRLSLPDALIASTALWYNIPLYTLNVKDFRYLPGIQLYESQ